MENNIDRLQKKRIILCLIIFLLMILVFFFSSQNGYDSRNTSSYAVTIIQKIYKHITNNDISKAKINLLTKVIRKLAHFTLYFIGAIPVFLFFLTYDMAKYKKYVYTILICFVYAISDEMHQFFIPQRDSRILDIFIDTFGSICGVVTVCIIKTIFRKIKNKVS